MQTTNITNNNGLINFLTPNLGYLLLLVTCLVFYGNTIFNEYSLDDYIVRDNYYVNQGLSGIYGIFTSNYINDESGSYEYRPIVLVTFAIEYFFFGKNTYISHGINILLYLITVLYLFYVFKKLLPNYNIVIPFLIAFLFCIHPIHTEVVASLKNRDELLAFLFSLVSLQTAVSFVNKKKWISIIICVLSFCLAFLSKKSMIPFIAIIPIAIHYFTNSEFKFIFFKNTNKFEIISWIIFFIIFLNLGIHFIRKSIFVLGIVYHLFLLFSNKGNNASAITLTNKEKILQILKFLLIGLFAGFLTLIPWSIGTFALYLCVLSLLLLNKLKTHNGFFILLGYQIGSFLVFWYYVQNILVLFPENGNISRGVDFYENPLYFENDIFTILGTGLYSLLYYIRLLIFPYPLSCYYGFNTIQIINILNPFAIFSLLLHSGLGIWALINAKKRSLLSFGILFYLASISLFSNIIEPAVGIIADRFVYSASLGFVIIVTMLLIKLLKINTEKTTDTLKYYPTLFVILLPITLLSAFKTIQRNAEWRNSLTLFKADAQRMTNSTKVQHLYGQDLLDKIPQGYFKGDEEAKMTQVSINAFKKAVDIYPQFTLAWQNMGYMQFRLGLLEESITSSLQALKLAPYYPEAAFNAAFCYEKQGNLKQALEFYQLSNNLHPKGKSAKPALEGIKRIQNQQSFEAVEKEVELKHNLNNITQYDELAKSYYLSGKVEKALKTWEDGLQIDPTNLALIFKLSKAYEEQNDTLKANYYKNLLKKYSTTQ